MPAPIRHTFGHFRRGLRNGRARFAGEDGVISVEAALWLPFFIIFLTLVVDAAMVFYGQARVLQVAQDANRGLSTGRFTSVAQSSEYIRTNLKKLAPNATSTSSFDKGLITTVVTVPTRDLVAVGFVTKFASIKMNVVAQMVQEY